jgi:hypothetical protein
MTNRDSCIGELPKALHHHPEAEVKRQAEQWLERFQESVEAWTICDRVLHDPTSTPEVNFMSAQALKRKVCAKFPASRRTAFFSFTSSSALLLPDDCFQSSLNPPLFLTLISFTSLRCLKRSNKISLNCHLRQ